MKTIYKIILPILTLILTISAVVIGSVAVAKAYKEPEINSAYAIGLAKFFEYDATEMFVDGPWPTDYIKREVEDKDLIDSVQKSLRDIIEEEVFVTTSEFKYNPKEDGSGWRYALTFTINNIYYGFSVYEYKLKVSVGGKVSYYYTDCIMKINSLINETVDYLSPEQT